MSQKINKLNFNDFHILHAQIIEKKLVLIFILNIGTYSYKLFVYTYTIYIIQQSYK